MATGVTVYGLRGKEAAPVWRLEASWWDDNELRRDPRFNYTTKIAGFHDYVADMTLAEALELADKYQANAYPWQRSAAETLRLRLEAVGGHVSMVRVLVFEWGGTKNAPLDGRID